MQIQIKVKPSAGINCLDRTKDVWIIKVTEPADKNKANKAVIKIISEELKIAKSRVQIVKGLKSRNKIVELSC